jgi:hypothetical protein
VSLDINPSISYSLNEFNRVIAVDGMNDEGEAIVDAIGSSLKNRDLATALTITVEQLSTEAYLDADTNYMVIGVYSDKDSKADALMSTVDAFSANAVDVCSITTVNVSSELKETADSYGITGGKMALINEITTVASDSDKVDPSVLAELTVAELEQTKEAAQGGASLADAVAAATPDNEPAAASTDPTSVASESKPESTENSSSKKGESASKPGVASDTAIDNKEPAAPSSTNTSTGSAAAGNTSTTSTDKSSNTSTDKNGSGSSDKKDDEKPADSDSDSDSNTGSDEKGEITSSEPKGETGSSPAKGEAASSESKDQVTEDDSAKTNSDLDALSPAVQSETLPSLPSEDEDDEIDTIGIPS